MEKGLVQIYTGNGKGKTTAATGLALRAAGRGLKVAFIQFLKSDDSGEVMYIEKNIPEIIFMRCNTLKKSPWQMNDDELEFLKKETHSGLEFVKELISSSGTDLIILDEIMGACGRGFVSAREILEIINTKNESIEVVMTGREAPHELIEAADLVTEMKKIKHPFDKGIMARTGIER